MPFRSRVKRLFGALEEKELADTGNKHDHAASGKPPDDSPTETKTAEPVPPPAPVTQPHCFKLKGLWSEAYEQLREEDEAIAAYEKDLLTQYNEQPGYTRDRHDADEESQLRHFVERRLRDIQETRLQFSIGGRKIVVKDQARRIIHGVLSVKDLITTAVSSEPHAALAWAGVLVLLNPVSKAITQDEDAINGFEQISNLLIRYRLLESTHVEIYTTTNLSSKPKKPLEEVQASLRAKTLKLYKYVLRYQMRLAKHYSHSGLFRLLEDLVVADGWKDMLELIVKIDHNINTELRTLGAHTLKEIDHKIDDLCMQMSTSLNLVTEARDEAKASKQLQLLDKLSYATGAMFNSYDSKGKRKCLEGTQVDMLTKVREWIEDPEGRPIFWLRGMAGTGKSTISRTLAAASDGRQRLATKEPWPDTLCLGASFFFNHLDSLLNNARRLFTTVAWSLAQVSPSLKDLVCDAIDRHPSIGDELPQNQWDYLIFQPLLALDTQILSTLTMIFVIDALDECKPESDLSLIIRLMTRVQELRTIKIRFFLTSRPEAHIRSYFRRVSESFIHEAVLNKVPVSGSEENPKNDILLFLTHEMAVIKDKNQITENWPGQETLQKLARKADGLFIYADTACRFLDAPNVMTSSRLNTRLKVIFDDNIAHKSPWETLDNIYTDILRFSVLGEQAIEDEKVEVLKSFKEVVGSIIILSRPLSPKCLSELLKTPLATVMDTLKGLHSVLAVPEEPDGTVQLLHLSFRDFLIDNQRCHDKDFCISEPIAHKTLFQRCLEIMTHNLHRDICCLHDSAITVSEVDQSLITQHIPIYLEYACRYWTHHLRQSGVEPTDNGEVHQFLKDHLLHWLEVMTLLGKMHEGVRMIMELSEYLAIVPEGKKNKVGSFVRDAVRFILKFRSLIEIAPLQVYTSAVIFSPQESIVRNVFKNHTPKWLRRMPPMDLEWDPLIQTLQPHDGENMALTPDGRLVASASGRIWDTATGTLVKQLEPWKTGGWIEFLENGKVLISISSHGDVRKWEVAAGLLTFDISPHEGLLGYAVFSHNRNVAAVTYRMRGSPNIMIIHTVDGKYLYTGERHDSAIDALALSSDGAWLASASGNSIFLWDTTTGELRCTLSGHRDRVMSVTFSLNDQLVATADSESIKIWYTGSEIPTTTIEPPTEMVASALAFSPDSTLLASTDIDGYLRLWEADTGALLRIIDGGFVSPLFSPKGDFLTSTVNRYTGKVHTNKIAMWATETGKMTKVVTSRGYAATKILFSSDGTILASAAKTVLQLWDMTLKPYQTPSADAHSYRVDSVKLTPNAERAMSFSWYDSYKLWDTITGDMISESSIVDSMKVISPDGALMAASSSQSIEVLDLVTGTLLRTLTGHTTEIKCMSFASNSTILASASRAHSYRVDSYRIKSVEDDNEAYSEDIDPLIRLWDANTGDLLQTFDGHRGIIECLSFSRDGCILAAGYFGGIVQLRDITTGELRLLLHIEEGNARRVLFTPDGKTVMSISHDTHNNENSYIRFWDIAAGELVRVFKLPHIVRVASISPNGNILATVSYEDEIHLWDAGTGDHLGCFGGMDVDSISFSEDGKFLHTGMGQVDVELICPSLVIGQSSRRGQGIFVRGPWVCRGSEKLLMLPNEYRAICADYRDGVLVMGHEDGGVSILHFDLDEMDCA